MTETSAMNIWQKLAGIRKMAAVVKKSANGYNYSYSPEDEILANVTAGMDKYRVGLHLDIDPAYDIRPFDYEKSKRGKNGEMITEKINEWLFRGVMNFRWVNIDNPEEFVVGKWPLIGQQADASQAFGAATTYCNRYFMLKYFQSATTKDDPDNYRSKQKEAADREDAETAKAMITALHETVTGYLETYPDQRAALLDIIPQYVKVNGRGSKDYFKVKDPEVAAELQKAMLEYMEKNATKKTAKSK